MRPGAILALISNSKSNKVTHLGRKRFCTPDKFRWISKTRKIADFSIHSSKFLPCPFQTAKGSFPGIESSYLAWRRRIHTAVFTQLVVYGKEFKGKPPCWRRLLQQSAYVLRTNFGFKNPKNIDSLRTTSKEHGAFDAHPIRRNPTSQTFHVRWFRHPHTQIQDIFEGSRDILWMLLFTSCVDAKQAGRTRIINSKMSLTPEPRKSSTGWDSAMHRNSDKQWSKPEKFHEIFPAMGPNSTVPRKPHFLIIATLDLDFFVKFTGNFSAPFRVLGTKLTIMNKHVWTKLKLQLFATKLPPKKNWCFHCHWLLLAQLQLWP